MGTIVPIRPTTNLSPLEQLRKFVEWEMENNPNKTHIAAWALLEIEKLNSAENKAELLAEDIECLHMCLDDAGVPRTDEKGNTYSMWGRVRLFKDMPPLSVMKE